MIYKITGTKDQLRITIPAHICELLKLLRGQKVYWKFESEKSHCLLLKVSNGSYFETTLTENKENNQIITTLPKTLAKMWGVAVGSSIKWDIQGDHAVLEKA